MAHFAKIDEQNIVQQVIVVGNENSPDPFPQSEPAGQAFISALGLDGTWMQTSYNGTFRKNYAGIGYTYDEQRDAFIPPKPFESWVLNEDTCLWNAPVPYPDDGKLYLWDEASASWMLAPESEEPPA